MLIFIRVIISIGHNLCSSGQRVSKKLRILANNFLLAWPALVTSSSMVWHWHCLRINNCSAILVNSVTALTRRLHCRVKILSVVPTSVYSQDVESFPHFARFCACANISLCSGYAISRSSRLPNCENPLTTQKREIITQFTATYTHEYIYSFHWQCTMTSNGRVNENDMITTKYDNLQPITITNWE